MDIEVRLLSYLAQVLPPDSRNSRIRVDISEGSTVADLLCNLRVPTSVNNTILVNGILKDKDTELKTGDIVSVSPPNEDKQ